MYSGFFLSKYKNEDIVRLKLRDFFQILILQELFSNKFRMDIVLQGLSAANLAYGITKGDNSLNFITIDQIKIPEFMKDIENLANKYTQIGIHKQYDKRYTFTVELMIRDGDFEIPMKVIITKVKYSWKRKVNFDVKVLEIPDWTIKVIAQVALLGEIARDNPLVEEFKKLNLNL